MRQMTETEGQEVMNHSIVSADRGTHLKIVVVALVGAIMVVAVGIAARISSAGIELAGVHAAQSTKVGVIRPASQPMTWSSSQTSTVR